ncbi:uncharacterized protein LOC111619519 [Centruroides sculpturatus]|uniref:uncharacterized protein LOC111619519 n=1 Tax=Centruroides sculpturatus TaxID=218467 RepID=UPI000C6E08D5|nr:uncharacterized protein LOC111619519 [Centruroides sculpturatus]
MCSIEQIEQFRRQRGSIINSKCVICDRQAWTDYYGNFACKRCVRFFIIAIVFVGGYKCISKTGNCDNYQICRFCLLERMYLKGFKAERFGNHGDGFHANDAIGRYVRPVDVDVLEDFYTKIWLGSYTDMMNSSVYLDDDFTSQRYYMPPTLYQRVYLRNYTLINKLASLFNTWFVD